jgi:signal transduction histidine kinase
MRWSIRLQILVSFCTTTILLLAVVSLVNAFFASRRVERQIESQLQDVGATLQASSFPWVESVLEQTRGLSGAEFVMTDQNSRVWASTVPVGESFDFVGETDSASPLGASLEVAGEPYFCRKLSRHRPGDSPQLQTLYVLYPERAWHQAWQLAVFPPLGVGALALCLVVVLSLVIAGRVTRPIERLREQVRQIAQGKYVPLPLPRRHDELRDLAVSVNSLAEQLDQTTRAVQRADRLTLLGQLSGGLAHQLRNAITGARMAVQLHQRHCQQDEESLAVALRQLTVTEDLLQQFLTVGQPQPLQKSDGDLRETLGEVAELADPACRHRHVRIDISPDLAPLPIHADHSRLRQLFLNLVINAMEAAPVDGWIRLHAESSPTEIRVRVTDNGPGPPAEMVDRLFEAFSTSKPEGVGLGLAVAQRIAESHGGQINFHREEATAFEVVLPVGRRDNPP